MPSHIPAATRTIPISTSLQDGLINAKICRFIAPAASFERTVYGECGFGLSPESSSTTTQIGLLNSFVGVEIVTKQIAGRDVQTEAASDLELETTVERTVSQRIGQERLRRQLLSYWNRRCALTHLNVVPLLRASHIKPWKDPTDSERLDEFNGLLLAPHIDAAFDRGFITFEDDGQLVVASALNEDAQQLLALNTVKNTVSFDERHVQRQRWVELVFVDTCVGVHRRASPSPSRMPEEQHADSATGRTWSIARWGAGLHPGRDRRLVRQAPTPPEGGRFSRQDETRASVGPFDTVEGLCR